MGERRDWESPEPRVAETPPGRAPEAVVQLVRFLVDLHRGRAEFRRVYGLVDGGVEDTVEDPDVLARRILDPATTGAAMRTVQQWMGEVMLHEAGLLEASQAAAQSGTKELLDRLDPTALAESVRRGSVRLGPFALAARSGPLLQQAVWEEFLRRFRELRRMDPAEYERFSRAGFREGYTAFHRARGAGRRSGAEPPGEEGGTS